MSCDLCVLLANADSGIDTSTELFAAPLWRNEQLAVVLVDDASYPGFCRVLWHAHVKEMSDLAPEQRSALMAVVWQVELAVRDVMAPDKVNLASLGNMTPHLHWHVIPRYLDDAHFPDPVWAAVRRTTAPAILAQRSALLGPLKSAILGRLNRH